MALPHWDIGRRSDSWISAGHSSRRQEGRDDFEYEIVLVSVAAGTPLNIAHLVVEHVHYTEADLV